MKRIITLTAVILIIFAGCTKNEDNQESTVVSESTELLSEDITTLNAEESSVKSTNLTTSTTAFTSSTAEKQTEANPTAKRTTDIVAETVTQAQSTLSTTAAQTTQKETQTVTTTQIQTENPGLNAVSPTTAKPTEAVAADKKITVTVFCSCKNAVDYGIRDKGDYGSFIPDNGILIDTVVKVAPNSTAMDAIKVACEQSDIEIDENRGYIKGIGDLYEKDCGGASGWLYSINGSFPNTSSDKYVLKANDRIELHYTVKNGDVTRM